MTIEYTCGEPGHDYLEHFQEVLLPIPVKVKLVGTDGNAFAIIGKVKKAIEDAGYPRLAKAFVAEATSGDYNNLLQTAMRFVEVT